MQTDIAVLFDIDGTLLDSTYHHALAWQRAFHALGMPMPLWRLHRSIGMGGDRLVTEVADRSVEEQHGDELRSLWRKEYVALKDEVLPLPDAAELVHRLTRQGMQVALASSGDPEFSREAVDLLGIGDEIAALTTSDDVDSSKPAPDLVQEALSRLEGVSQAVFVGDTPYDVDAARRARLRCVALRSGGYSTAELANSGAALVVDTPHDLLDLTWTEYLSPVS